MPDFAKDHQEYAALLAEVNAAVEAYMAAPDDRARLLAHDRYLRASRELGELLLRLVLPKPDQEAPSN